MKNGIDLNARKRAFGMLFISHSVSIFRIKKKSQGDGIQAPQVYVSTENQAVVPLLISTELSGTVSV